MSLVRDYASILRNATGWHPVFPPIVSAVAVGDYGYFREGAFTRLGNIHTDFDIDPAPRALPAAMVSLTSASTRLIRQQAGAEVAAFTAADVAAELVIELSKANSFVLRTGSVTATTVASPNLIIGAVDLVPAWRRSWWVVGTVYVGAPVLFLASRQTGTRVTITGKASDLLQLETTGAFNLGLGFGATHELALELHGAAGPIAVSAFRRGLFGGTVNKADGEPVADAEIEHLTVAPDDAF